eukprot:TRINITY_DN168_c0_g2_i1.p1 TRINITY_DN168_c0_g2~~TRINITY_DN168_c0_g2_i1.p1  ORF type:complete len:446 (-),score=124.40 TRINITY_DN168_c0_g2_i1:226-1434(-)
MLKHVFCYSSFSNISMGGYLPLLNAMETYAEATGEFEQLRKSFSTTCLMARHLKRKESMDTDALLNWVRHSLMKIIFATILKMGKTDAENSDSRSKMWFDKNFDDQFYETYHGICFVNSTHIPSTEECLKWFIPDFDVMKRIMERVCNVLDVKEIIDQNQIALLLAVLRFNWTEKQLAQFNLESFMTELLEDKNVKDIWDGVIDVDPLVLLNERFEGFYHPTNKNFSLIQVPSFITPFGSSCYVGTDGKTKFGNWEEEITDENMENINNARREYLRCTYGSNDMNGYPMAKAAKASSLGSAHYPLHRGVQRVLTLEEFKNDHEIREEHIKAVAEYLLIQNKGFFYYSGIQEVIPKAIKSYLICRNKGMKEPENDEAIKFAKKLMYEREVRLSGLADDIPPSL